MERDNTDNKTAAIIGFGGMGQRHHKALKNLGVEIIGITDWDTKKVQEYDPDFPENLIFKDADSLLRSVNPDLICVATNGPTHADITQKASESGVPRIFCEKPIATNLIDAGNSIDVCKKNGTRIAVNHIRRHSTTHSQIAQLIRDDTIGSLRHIYIQCGSTGLGNMGVHFFDLMRLYAESEVDFCVGFIDNTGTPNVRGAQFKDPGGYGIIHFQNGIRVFLDTSEDTGVSFIIELVGVYGRIVIDELNSRYFVYARDNESRAKPLTRYTEPLKEIEFEPDTLFDIVDLTGLAMEELLGNGKISSTGEDGYKALELVIGFHLSEERDNQKILFPIEGDDLNKDVLIA